MLCVLLLFLGATIACESLLHLLWVYEVRVHGAAAPSGARQAYLVTALADWAALVFVLIASAIAMASRPRVPARCPGPKSEG